MNDMIVETFDLTHRFGPDTALDNVGLQVPKGSIYGFLGPNGAGKTTTLRLLLGLLRIQEGRVRVFGEDFAKNRVRCLARIGSLIESPSVYGHLTARENLRAQQLVRGGPASEIDDVLALVGLSGTGSKRAANFSLGMKQRLGLAAALLGGPELLILDEPTNGLDPNGIVEMRELLRHLNRERGTTIIVSSHLLDEVERIVTHVGVIARGRLRFQGTYAALVERRRRSAVFRTSDDSRALALVRAAGIGAEASGGGLALDSEFAGDDELVAKSCAAIVNGGVGIFAVERGGNDLESDFFALTEVSE